MVVLAIPEETDFEIEAGDTPMTIVMKVHAVIPDAFMAKVAELVRLDKGVLVEYFEPQCKTYRLYTSLPVALGEMEEQKISPFVLCTAKLVRGKTMRKRKAVAVAR